jgi:hypothetical protein
MAAHNRKFLLRAVAAPTRAARPPEDPIYSVIEAHQKAKRDERDAVRLADAYEDNTVCKLNMNAQQTADHNELERAVSVAFDRLKEMSIALVTTKPTTIAGIGAACRYMKSLLLEEGTAGLLLREDCDNDSDPGMATFCDTIAAAIEAGIQEGSS